MIKWEQKTQMDRETFVWVCLRELGVKDGTGKPLMGEVRDNQPYLRIWGVCVCWVLLQCSSIALWHFDKQSSSLLVGELMRGPVWWGPAAVCVGSLTGTWPLMSLSFLPPLSVSLILSFSLTPSSLTQEHSSGQCSTWVYFCIDKYLLKCDLPLCCVNSDWIAYEFALFF